MADLVSNLLRSLDELEERVTAFVQERHTPGERAEMAAGLLLVSLHVRMVQLRLAHRLGMSLAALEALD